MTRWFTSDHHFFHDNIIAYGGRPFSNVAEMHEALLTYHNELVKPEDHVSWLGDVTILRGNRQNQEKMIKEVRKYNGHKRLYLGNHDHFGVKVYLDAGFEKVYGTWRDEGRILFSHIPIHPRSIGSAIANVHGHCHQIEDYEPIMTIDKSTQRIKYVPYINICVERTNYRPLSYDDILGRINKSKGEWDGVNSGIRQQK